MNFQELTTPLSPAAVETMIYASITARGGAPETWKPKSTMRSVIAGFAIVVSGMSQLTAAIARGGFLETAEGDWLTLYARHVYFVERLAAIRASGNVTLTNTGGGYFELEPGDLIVTTGDGTKSYRNTASFTLSPGASISVPVEAVEAGAIGTTVAGTITAFDTVLLGVTVVNATAFVGRDAETDEQLRFRCAAKLGALSANGPREAYYFVALSAVRADGEPIGVTRVRTKADGYGGVAVYVASASGPLTSPDLAIVDAEIQSKVVPDGVTATVQSAVAVDVPITYELWVRDTCPLTNAQIEAAVRAAVVAWAGRSPIGGMRLPGQPGRLYRSGIAAAIGGALPVGDAVELQLAAPAGDVDLEANEAAVVTTVVATSIHRVAQ